MFAVFGQLIDFFFKAIVAFLETPVGQKEFADIEKAWEAAQGTAGAPQAERPRGRAAAAQVQ